MMKYGRLLKSKRSLRALVYVLSRIRGFGSVATACVIEPES